jgi:5-formyltetrahydrofolate cyclo-ligase
MENNTNIVGKFMKTQLRKELISIRDSISVAKKSNYDRFFTQNILTSDLYKISENILLYFSIGSEFNTEMLLKQALNDGKTVYFPKILSENGIQFMDFFEYTGETILGNFSIREPVSDIKITDFNSVLMLVPALSVDNNFHRLGYGGGFYDKFLALHPEIRTIATCYSECFWNELPFESHDIQIDILYKFTEPLSY